MGRGPKPGDHNRFAIGKKLPQVEALIKKGARDVRTRSLYPARSNCASPKDRGDHDESYKTADTLVRGFGITVAPNLFQKLAQDLFAMFDLRHDSFGRVTQSRPKCVCLKAVGYFKP